MPSLYVPLTTVTDGDLVRLGERNPGWRIERADSGELRLSPTHSDSGAKSLTAAAQSWIYARQVGGKAYDSSTGFKTPRGGVLSPDASWISPERVAAFDDAERRAYRTITPDVVIEIKSDSDDWDDVIAKIDRYRADGAAYAVAIDLDGREVYATGAPPTGLALDFEAISDA